MAKKGKPKSKEVNPYMETWMLGRGFKTLSEASLGTGVPKSTMYSLADMHKSHEIFASILDTAEKMGLEPGELMRGVLNGKSPGDEEPPLKNVAAR